MLKIPKLENIADRLNAYIDARVELVKLDLKSELSDWITRIGVLLVVSFTALFALVLLSVAAALAIGHWQQSNALGFLCIAGVYLGILGVIQIKSVQKNLKNAIFGWIEKSLSHSATKNTTKDERNGVL
jgi:hypothetical protein